MAVIPVGPAGPVSVTVTRAAPYLEAVGGGEVILADPGAEARAIYERMAQPRRCVVCDDGALVAFIARLTAGHYRNAFYLDLCAGCARTLTAELGLLSGGPPGPGRATR